MIDIFNEVGYIKNVISNGLSPKWERDVTLLVRYYKDYESKKKSWIKNEIKSKCEQAATRAQDPINYNPLISYKRLNKIIDSAYRKSVPLRQIQSVEFPREVLDWFLSLETSYTISPEEQDALRTRRKGTSIKNCRPINWKRTKYLFTLYIWTLIQQNYLDRPNMHYLKQYGKRFKEDADLPASFSLQKERNLLYDLKLIDVNFSLGIDTSPFMSLPVFQTPITDKNRILLTISEGSVTINGKDYMTESGDLHYPGYWLEKQKMGSFTCQECGKEFAHYTNSKRERARKYCKECAQKREHGVSNTEYREFICIDCGAVKRTSKYDSKTVRCYKCQMKHRAELAKAYRDSVKSVDDPPVFSILGEPL